MLTRRIILVKDGVPDIEVNSPDELHSIHGMPKHLISRLLSGNIKNLKGYQLAPEPASQPAINAPINNPPNRAPQQVRLLSTSGELTVRRSMSAWITEFGVYLTQIKRLINGEIQEYRGWRPVPADYVEPNQVEVHNLGVVLDNQAINVPVRQLVRPVYTGVVPILSIPVVPIIDFPIYELNIGESFWVPETDRQIEDFADPELLVAYLPANVYIARPFEMDGTMGTLVGRVR